MATNSYNIQASGGDYTTLALWEDDRDTNGTTSTDIEIAVLNAAESFAGCTVSGWIARTGEGLIRVTCAASYQHNGDVNSSTGGGQAVLNSDLQAAEEYTEFVDLFSVNSANAGFVITSDNTTFTRCISKGAANVGFSGAGNGSSSLINCIALNGGKRGFNCDGGPGYNLYHCLAYGNTRSGFNVPVPASHYFSQVRNCISVNNGNGSTYFDLRNMNHASSDNDYILYGTSTASTPGSNSVGSVVETASTAPSAGTWVGFTNITGGSEDFELIEFTNSEVNEALAAGVSGTGVTDDILERSRDGTTPDIGPFEFQHPSTFTPKTTWIM